MSKVEGEGFTVSTEDGVSRREYQHHRWTIETCKSHILESKCKYPEICGQSQDSKCLFCKFNDCLEISHMPDMTFARNVLRITHEDGFGIEFNAMDALKEVKKRCEERVYASEEWLKAREEQQEAQFINQNFDWTFTTEYVGTLLPGESKVDIPNLNKLAQMGLKQIKRIKSSEENANEIDNTIQVQPSKLSIDFQKLKVREEILFFDEIDLFEDELADNGVSKLNIRIRVMPSKIYILMRFYLRVDRIKVKVYDTRIYHEEGTNFFERDITRHEVELDEKNLNTLGDIHNPEEFTKRVSPQITINQRLVFPEKSSPQDK